MTRPETSAGKRIAIIAHGHPDFSLGGAEIAAYNLYLAYRDHPEIESAVFLAAHRRPGEGPTNMITPRRPGEYLWSREMIDWHMFKGFNRLQANQRFAAWLEMVRPDIVHVHHYAHMGIEMFDTIRKTCPDTQIILTLHEYQAICKNHGQMVKTGEGTRLCLRESLEDCHRCFPSLSREDFWLRKNFIQTHFSVIDGFVAPSDFLRQRYVDWGIPDDRITTIENGQILNAPTPHREAGPGGARNRFGFFGQLNPFKGIDVMLEALAITIEQDAAPVQLEVHGANLEMQAPEFIEKILALRDKLLPTGRLQWHGPYEQENLAARMRNIDWVVMPSIWWENSPMVIQEAYMHRRPVIASNIGGMAEKTATGTPETHVEPRSPLALAEAMTTLAADTALWEENVARIPPPLTNTDSAAAHLAWFGEMAR
ncbi:glycosyltransferase [Pseudohoeflea suaedae]|uniref:Glycosyltransferase n=1 Tax=Pseudohoeflea suaedae TaxID=877384 RepID=A0A4R5PNW6_9HYPH|nr:glycosyltransferase family 4 protein [Pseudohoeflea suaedae]TDH38736.1 glycosyltransferase [Pseudohoeflea suaedae]